MGKVKTIARRTFLIGSAAVAGGLVVGYWRYKTPYANPLLDELEPGEAALTPYVRIDQSGITIITPRAEMGQGIHTTLAAMVAEELDVALDAINVEHGPASKAYFNAALLEEAAGYPAYDLSASAERVRGLTKIPAKFLGLQITGGSTSTVDGFVKMRKSGAAARLMLLQAAADTLGVETTELVTQNGAVHAPDGQVLRYESLAVAAGAVEAPDDPPLKPESQWTLLGKSLPRIDMVGKVTGTAEYAIDVRLPEMLYATVRMNPNLGGALKSFDASAAEAMPGVKKVIELEGGVAVVATNTWYAFKAAEAIECEWETANYPAETAGHFAAVAAAFDDDADSDMRDDGDVDTAMIEGADLEAEYRVPYLAHATMEPLNAVAWVRDSKLDIWAGTQFPTQAVKEGEDITGIDADNIRVHTTYMGGGFGRRSEMDFIKQTLRVANEMHGFPIKLTWSREEDTRHGTYRPPAIARFRANIGDGKPSAIDLQLSAPSVTESQLGRIGLSAPGPDVSIVQSAWDQPYRVDNYRVTGYRPPVMLPISYWRSVGASQNGFFHECMLDEIAVTADADP
ncbi:MAG: molybdopterin cofactor-binding domain-containing protein, partial [Pseudomonadota bacterium]